MSGSREDVADLADRCFQQGHNCAQSVLRAVAETRGMACPRCIPAVALAMGGGIGHTGKACGALTGGVMAVGLAVDRHVAGPIEARKAEANRLAGKFVTDFTARFGSPDCAALLGFSWSEPDAPERFARENAKAARCTPCVRWAAAEVDRLLAAALPR